MAAAPRSGPSAPCVGALELILVRACCFHLASCVAHAARGECGMWETIRSASPTCAQCERVAARRALCMRVYVCDRVINKTTRYHTDIWHMRGADLAPRAESAKSESSPSLDSPTPSIGCRSRPTHVVVEVVVGSDDNVCARECVRVAPPSRVRRLLCGHPVRSPTQEESPTGMLTARWDGLRPFQHPFYSTAHTKTTQNARHLGVTDTPCKQLGRQVR